jgi:hypothetical protein
MRSFDLPDERKLIPFALSSGLLRIKFPAVSTTYGYDILQFQNGAINSWALCFTDTVLDKIVDYYLDHCVKRRPHSGDLLNNFSIGSVLLQHISNSVNMPLNPRESLIDFGTLVVRRILSPWIGGACIGFIDLAIRKPNCHAQRG